MKPPVTLGLQALREQADAMVRTEALQAAGSDQRLSPDALQKTLYELRVHQIELEMQNEELRHVQLSLDAERERYFDLYDLAPVGYCTVSAQGFILEANLTAATLLGIVRRSLVKEPLNRFVDKADQDNYYLIRKRLLETGQPQSSELQMVPRAGPPFWASLVASLVHSEDSADVMRVVLSDISERKRMAMELDQLMQEQSAILASGIAGIVKLKERQIVWSNATFAEMLGYGQQELTGQPTRVCYASDEDYAAFAHAYPVIEGGQVFQGEVQFQRKDGRLLWVKISGSMLRPETGETIWSLVDINDGKLADVARQTALDLIRNITSRVPGMVYQYLLRPDGSSCFPYTSDAIRDIYRVSPEQVRDDAGKVFAALHPDDFDAVVASIQVSASDLTPWHHEYRVMFADGTINWLLGSATPQRQRDGAVLWHGFISNINDRRHIELVLKQSEQRLRISEKQMVIAQKISATGSWTYDLASDKIWGSAEGLRIFGYPALARDFAIAEIEACIPERERVHQALHDLIHEGREYDIEYTINPADGSAPRIVQSVATLETDEQAKPRLVLGFVQDITKLKQVNEQVRQLAFYDPLTALPNRRLLLDRLDQALSAAQRSSCYCALMFLDLDNFKPLNDSHGHEAGDLLLIEVALRLRECVRAMDTVARIGGDEFVVLMGGLTTCETESIEQARKVAEKIRAALAEPYVLSCANSTASSPSIEHRCTASIGVVLFNMLDLDQNELLRRADAAMYQAKENGRNRVQFHGK